VIFGQKLTLNHPSLMDEEKETSVFVTAHKREGEKREREFMYNYRIVFLSSFYLHDHIS